MDPTNVLIIILLFSLLLASKGDCTKFRNKQKRNGESRILSSSRVSPFTDWVKFQSDLVCKKKEPSYSIINMASPAGKRYPLRRGGSRSKRDPETDKSMPVTWDDEVEPEAGGSNYDMASQNSETLEYSMEETSHSYGPGDFGSSDEGDDGKRPKGKQNARQTDLRSYFSKDKNSKRDDDPRKESKKVKLKKMKYSDADTAEYRMGYPGKIDDPRLTENFEFYSGKIQSHPRGDFIDDIHTTWFGHYDLLEEHHGYIQWIFPIRENGMNWHAQALQLHEAKRIQSDPQARKRVLRSYEMMLDFYGMELADKDTGRIKRSRNWKSRFDNLSWSSHNYLRITRILKSLGELGFEHMKKPFLEFVMDEGMKKKNADPSDEKLQGLLDRHHKK